MSPEYNDAYNHAMQFIDITDEAKQALKAEFQRIFMAGVATGMGQAIGIVMGEKK